MDIDGIPEGTTIFMDANIIYHFADLSEKCARFPRRVARGVDGLRVWKPMDVI